MSFFSALQALLALSCPLAFLPLAMHQPPLESQYSNLIKILPFQCSNYDKDCRVFFMCMGSKVFGDTDA